MRKSFLLAGVVGLTLFTAACGSSPTKPVAPVASAVTVTLDEFSVTASASTIQAGVVTLNVRNAGKIPHELLIFKTSSPLPMKDGNVDEEGADKVFDTGDSIDVGSSKTFTATLATGSYTLVCNLPGHYMGGMHSTVVVK